MPLSALRILVIEDEFLIAMDAERILTEAGADRVVLSTRKDLRDNIQNNTFDIVLLDVGPHMTGLDEEIELISNSGSKIAFVTSDEELLASMPDHDPHLVISKPYDEKQLAALVELLASLASRERAHSNGC